MSPTNALPPPPPPRPLRRGSCTSAAGAACSSAPVAPQLHRVPQLRDRLGAEALAEQLAAEVRGEAAEGAVELRGGPARPRRLAVGETVILLHPQQVSLSSIPG